MQRQHPLASVAIAAGALLGASSPALSPALAGKPLPAGRHQVVQGKSRSKHRKPTKGAFGGGKAARAKKAAFLAQSSEDAKRIANEASLKREYARWRAGMTPEERAAARALGVLTPLAHDGAPRGGRHFQALDVEFHDPADLPEAADPRTPVDVLEPQTLFSVAIENLACAEVTAAADTFGEVLTWCLDVPDQRDVVLIGHKALVATWLLRPDLITGDALRQLPTREIADAVHCVSADEARLASTGEIFGRVLEWVRKGRTVAEIGGRLCLVAYVVRPTIMGSPTLQQLGDAMNKTRQAADKLANCLRDTFAGIRAMAQRGEFTRDRCAAAH